MKTNELLKSYNLLKRKYDKAVVLIRNEDSYITFKEDAQCLAGVMGADLKLAESGIPTYYSHFKVVRLDEAIHLFTLKSLTVAICDPLTHIKERTAK